ncbi:hypothetical protein A3K82_01860 [Candidatus Pacearchaeota archaeon RBG_19FT_COMBO_34_9]|nr:MAG: hypothetical protein A3K82_01860 [Candidatus Pacearchaeota archaeon RBG_19FT_COMBO_34_9]OGJ16727.1 MAG: hypothetical protein A3K74_00735 [Candidatus Pacearchaeota archaeon RBG_13_33_26]
MVVNPIINTGEDKKATLDYLRTKIIENVTAEFISASIQLNSSNPFSTSKNCIILEGFLASTEMYYPNIIIQDKNGYIQEAYADFANLKINRLNKDFLFFRAYYSPEFNALGDNPSLSCYTLKDYSGSVKADKYIFEKNMYEFIDLYRNNYENLKTQLKIPTENEFGFAFIQRNGTKIEVSQEITSKNVYADEIPIQYVNNNSNIVTGFMNIKIW